MHDSLEAKAHDALADWLVNEHPRPGTPIPLRELARNLGMSRTPVRTAVGRLYERGLVDYSNSTGFTVAVPSPGSMYELFEMRLMIETHSIRMFAESGDRLPGSFEQLVDEAESLLPDALSEPGKYLEFRRNDAVFHRCIVKLSGLPRLCALHDDLDLSIHVTRAGLEAPITAERLQTALQEHRRVFEALRAGDAEKARAHLAAHITRVRDATIIILSRPRD